MKTISKTLLIFSLCFISIVGKAQFCMEFTTSYELDRCLQQKTEKRLNAFVEERNIDLEFVLSSFNTYLIALGFANPDAMGAGYVNFLKHLASPTDKTELVNSLDAIILQNIFSSIEKLRNAEFCFWSLSYVYLRDFGEDCIEWDEYYLSEPIGISDDCLHLESIVENTLAFRFFYEVFQPIIHFGDMSMLITMHEEEMYNKPIYQFFYLSVLSRFHFPYLSRIINGEAIFLCSFLDNREEFLGNSLIIVDDASPIAKELPVHVNFTFTSSGELEDVEFRCQRTWKILGDKDVSNELREIFKNSNFVIGLHNGQPVTYIGARGIVVRHSR